MGGILRVKNWKKFQHFSNRRPPWIKLYREILDDYTFHSLPVESRALAPMLWLIASENHGEIPYDINMISFRLRSDIKTISAAIKPLISSGFFELDITMISERYQVDTLEREREGEEEKEVRKRKEVKKKIEKKELEVLEVPPWIDQETWNDFLRMRIEMKKPLSAVAAKLIINDLNKWRGEGDDANECLRESIKNNWRGVFRRERSRKSRSGSRKYDAAAAMRELLESERNAQDAADDLFRAARPVWDDGRGN